ncbi:MAG: AAA family ATPase [Promethearchaeota archaeon]
MQNRKLNRNRSPVKLGELFFESLNEFIEELSDVLEIKKTKEIELEKVAELLKVLQSKKEKDRFKARMPLGIIIPPIQQIDYCFALKYSMNEKRPKINQIVLIFDSKYNEVYSGIINSIKIPKTNGKLDFSEKKNVATTTEILSGKNNEISDKKRKDTKSKNVKTVKTDASDLSSNQLDQGNEAVNKPIATSTLMIFGVRLLFKHNMELTETFRISTIISEESFVFNATSKEIEKIFGVPEEGIQLGICTNNGEIIDTDTGPLYYNLDPELLKTHMCVAGLTGRGKTIFLKNFIFNLVKQELNPPIHSIIFDLQGDLVQIMKKMPKAIIPKKYLPLYEDLGLELNGLEDYLIQNEILFLKPFYIKTEGFLKLFPWKNFGLRSYHIKTGEELANFMPDLTSKARSTLIMLFNLFISRVNLFHFETFYQYVYNNKKMVSKGKYKWTIPESNEEIEIPASTGDAMIRELMKLRNLDVFDVFEEIDIGEMLRKKVVFIYFPSQEGYSYVRSIFLMQILRQIYDYKIHRKLQIIVKNKAEKNSKGNANSTKSTKGRIKKDFNKIIEKIKQNKQIINNLIIIDEAHELLPARKQSAQFSEFFNFIENEFKDIAKKGRKYGLWLVVSTQMLSELNKVVVQNAQTRILFELSPEDEKLINADRLLKSYLRNLKQGEAVVYNRDNLKISSIMEIKTIPPVFLHCDPPQADLIFEEEVQYILNRRGELEDEEIEEPIDIKPPSLTSTTKENKNGKENDKMKDNQKLKIEEFLKAINLSSNNMVPRVTNVHNASVMDVELEVLHDIIQSALKKAGIYGSHFNKIIQDISIALQDEKVIGIKLLGPSGEGKTQFAFALANSICIGGTKGYYAVSEATLEEDLFFGINPRSIVNKDAPEFTLGVICQSIIEKTLPILDEANRAPERIYRGKALTAMADQRYIIFPGNQLIKAPPDWKIIFIMNPFDIGTFSFPQSIENRLITIKIPYANDEASAKVLKTILHESEFDDVVDAFVKLRHLTMIVSPLDKEYHYLPESERKPNADIQLHGISMRILVRFGRKFKQYYKLLKSKKEAFRRAAEINCYSIFVEDIPEEREYFQSLINSVLYNINDE